MKAQKSQTVNKIKTALHLDSHARKQDGKSQFLLRVYIGNRKYIFIRTGRYMKKKFWIGKKIVAKSGNPHASELKSYLDGLVSKCESIVNAKIKEGKAITKRKLEVELFEQNFSASQGTMALVDYFEDVKQREASKGNTIGSTVEQYNWVHKTITEFDPEIPLADVDEKWLDKFQDWMRTTKNYSPNSVTSMLNKLRKVVTFACDQDEILSYNPFKKFKYARMHEGDKEFLTFDELQKLHAMYIGEELLKEKHVFGFKGTTCHAVLQVFLTSCYTGLRFSDVTTLKMTDFYGSIVRKKMQKTSRFNKWVSIPISSPLREVLDLDSKTEGDSVFGRKPYNSPHTNRVIKAVMQHAGINKHIAFHCSRHTFACVGLELGLSLEVISNILGHSSLNETRIYAKIQNRRIAEEMTAFDVIGGTPKRETKLKKVS